MKKYILGAVLSLGILASPAFTSAAGLSDSQVQAILSLLSSFGADSATIASVNSALTGTSGGGGGSGYCYNFSRDLTIGSTGNDVYALNHVLTLAGIDTLRNGDFSSVFDEDTAADVVTFQAKYGIRQTGYVGPLTRAKLNALYGCSIQTTTPVPTVGASLRVATYAGYGDQTIVPGTTMARLGSFTLSAGASEGVLVKALTISFSNSQTLRSVTNLMLRDHNTGTQLGATIAVPSAGNSFSSVNTDIPASSTKTIDIYGDILSSATGALQMMVTSSVSTGDASGSTVFINATPLQTITISSSATPTISYIQSKAANMGTIYVGEYPSIVGTGLSGTITVNIGGIRSVIAASDKDTVTTFLVPALPEGKYNVSVTNASGQTSNMYPVTLVVPTTTGTTASPTVSIIGTPTMRLSYDSSSRESALTASFTARVTAGSSDIAVSNLKNGIYANYFYTRLYNTGISGEKRTNSMTVPTVVSLSEPDIPFNGSSWTISAGKSADFSITSIAYPRELFADSYYEVLNFYNQNSTDIAPTNSTNSVAIVGEVSPYISNVTSDANGTINVSGSRLDLIGNGVIIDGSIGVGGTKGDSSWMSFGASTYNLANGRHFIQITNSRVGNSNTYYFDLNATTATTPAPTASIKVTGSGNGSDAIVSWDSTNASECSLYDNVGYIIKMGSLASGSRVGFVGTYTSGSLATTGSNTYNYGCSNSTGSTGWKSVTVPVTTTTTTPAPTVTLTAPSSVVSGQSPTVTWSSTDATYCTLTTGSIGDYGAGAAPLSGSLTIDSVTSNRTVKLTCNGAGGSAMQSVTVSVSAPSTIPASTVLSASITPSSTVVPYGKIITLTFNSTNAKNCGLASWDPPALTYKSTTITPNTTVDVTTVPLTTPQTTYAFQCTNDTSQSGWQYAFITVCAQGQVVSNNTCVAGSTSYNYGQNQMAGALGALGGLFSRSQSTLHYTWNNDLRVGSLNSADVQALQAALQLENVYTGDITGGFYAETLTGVKNLQQKYGLEATGFVGPQTRAKLNSLYSK